MKMYELKMKSENKANTFWNFHYFMTMHTTTSILFLKHAIEK